MNVINKHKRILNQPIGNISQLIKTLGTENDKFWPSHKWPPMRFNGKLKIGATGGHAGIKYYITNYNAGERITFKFTKPRGFIGIHEIQAKSITFNQTEISHEIRMTVSGKDILNWVFIVRWLHDALLEDAFDNIENQFLNDKKKTKYTLWVKILRSFYKLS